MPPEAPVTRTPLPTSPVSIRSELLQARDRRYRARLHLGRRTPRRSAERCCLPPSESAAFAPAAAYRQRVFEPLQTRINSHHGCDRPRPPKHRAARDAAAPRNADCRGRLLRDGAGRGASARPAAVPRRGGARGRTEAGAAPHRRRPERRISRDLCGPARARSRRAPRAQPEREQPLAARRQDRKSTRLNSSHVAISYAVFCLKKKNKKQLSLLFYKKTKKI